LWTPGSAVTQTLTVSLPGNYSVVVTHGNGCTKSDSTTIAENCPEVLFIPGAFTPNNDGKNDLFFADGTNVKNFKITVFNQWGQQVFDSALLGIAGGWNGKYNDAKAPEGLYTYVVNYDALKPNGKTKPETRTGSFVLIR
nr:gliding motility-associated C-terminal domain-containing protein [Bacteroidia bacterium]